MAEEKVSTAEKAEQVKEFEAMVMNDFRLVTYSREASLLGRKEVLTGKAKFGIFGDGKELAQVAMARFFEKGDFRSGYYRDQTFMMAIDQLSVEQFFAGLYAHTDLEHEPSSAGRQMGGHFATSSLNADGSWKNLTEQYNSSADVSPTASQMPRLLGLAQASKIYKENPDLHDYTMFSKQGNEVAWGTIGDASTSEGMFWETINAACVLKVPMLLSVWDDGYGISVEKKHQTTKGSISDALAGFAIEGESNGLRIFKTKGWDYVHLIKTYEEASAVCRDEHIPVLVHVEEVTQPQGHSTSGSHERYKSKERLEWAKEFDCINKFQKWIVDRGIATEDELTELQKGIKKEVRQMQKAAWSAYCVPIKAEQEEALALLDALAAESSNRVFVEKLRTELAQTLDPIRKDILSTARRALRYVRQEQNPAKQKLIEWLNEQKIANYDRYNAYLYSHSDEAATAVKEIAPTFDDEPQMVDGRLVLRDNFDHWFSNDPRLVTYGEDVGKIGGVNQSMEGMQAKHGELRVSDTGIRECTIIGQGIGMAMRGLRPVAEIQYLDYLLYALQIMSDDLATVHYRTKGQQKAPLIIRTRGHRLEGIWHSGSPMGTIIHSVRGMHVCVPRNMTHAAGFFNTLLRSADPALVVEPLNGYRKKEALPTNLGEFTVPLGVPEVVREGSDITLVSYGSTFNLAEEAVQQLQEVGISVEMIDVRTLLPFDVNHMIVESLENTNRLLVVDEDVPGGASAFMLDKILNEQGGYYHLDAQPVTLTAKAHRPAYASDGDYFSKPSIEDIFEAAYEMMHESDPSTFPSLY